MKSSKWITFQDVASSLEDSSAFVLNYKFIYNGFEGSDLNIPKEKITEYVIDDYKQQHELDELECENLIKFLKDCLDRKKLQRIKDVIYDKENED